MKAAELKKLLKEIPDDTEIVVGDLACGQFWNPVINRKPIFSTLRVNEEWAERQLHPVSFFALFNQTQRLTKENTPDVTSPSEVLVFNL